MTKQSKRVTSLDNTYTATKQMQDVQRDNRRKRLFRRLSVLGIFAAIIGIVMITYTVSRTGALEEKVAKKEALETQMVELQKEEDRLKLEIEKLNDDDYIAELARRDYFLSDEGEIIFTIPESEKTDSDADANENEDSE